MNERLSIKLSNEKNTDEGVWLKLPVFAEQLQTALAFIGVQGGEQNKDYFITGFESPIEAVKLLSLENLQNAEIDEINYLAAELAILEPEDIDVLNAIGEREGKWDNTAELLDYVYNTCVFEYIPGILTHTQLGEYYLKSDKIEIPEEWLDAVDVEKLGQLAAEDEGGVFIKQGYIAESGAGWISINEIPREYCVTKNKGMSQQIL